MEKKSFARNIEGAESARERGQEGARKALSKGAERELVRAGIGLHAKREKGELFTLRPEMLPKRRKPERPEHGPVTFDGFEEIGIPVDALREELDVVINQLSSSVRISFEKQSKIINETEVVAEYVEKPVGHVRITLRPVGYREDMPTREEVFDLLKREVFMATRWAAEGISVEEMSLVISSRRGTQKVWLEEATLSLMTRGIGVEEAAMKASKIVYDVSL